jgi:hypothetical protein
MSTMAMLIMYITVMCAVRVEMILLEMVLFSAIDLLSSSS